MSHCSSGCRSQGCDVHTNEEKMEQYENAVELQESVNPRSFLHHIVLVLLKVQSEPINGNSAHLQTKGRRVESGFTTSVVSPR